VLVDVGPDVDPAGTGGVELGHGLHELGRN
jgi:hypothetical protein